MLAVLLATLNRSTRFDRSRLMPSRNFCATSELAADLDDANVGVIDVS